MAFKLRIQQRGVSSQLALFILPPTDVGVERLDYVKYSPNNSISSSANINFEVPNDGLTFMDFAKTSLSINDLVPFINKNIAKGS